MSQFVETNTRKFTAGGAVAIYLRVKTPGALAAAGATDIELGTMEAAAFSSGDRVSVRMHSATGTAKMIAAAAITKGVLVYGAAGGKVSSTANVNPIGRALIAATANNDIVEVLRHPVNFPVLRTAEAHTADDTLGVAESGSIHTTFGATGTVVLTLPAAVVGLEYFFQVGAAEVLQIEPDTGETISLPSTGVAEAADDYITATIAGETVHLMCCEAGTWAVFGFTGTWTGE
jgi:hypothetical protein